MDTWNADEDWRRAQGGDWWEALAELRVVLSPVDRDRVWQELALQCRVEDDAVLDGGVAVLAVTDGLSLLSGGEDAISSLEYTAERVARAAQGCGATVLAWRELLPDEPTALA